MPSRPAPWIATLALVAVARLAAGAVPTPPPPTLPIPRVTPAPPRPTAAPPKVIGMPAPDAGLHDGFDRLLRAYVRADGVRYAAWQAAHADRLALSEYIHRLEAMDATGWPEASAKAYWINLYNAATLRLILMNYPLKSIKELKDPWDRKLVHLPNRDLSLNDIENTILRPTFKDPRVHFALNCAAVGCPPLRIGAYTPDSLDIQLNANCRRTLGDAKYLSIDGYTVRMTEIFAWYAADFQPDSMAVREFMSRYVPDLVARKLTDPMYSLVPLEYDWKLNRAAE